VFEIASNVEKAGLESINHLPTSHKHDNEHGPDEILEKFSLYFFRIIWTTYEFLLVGTIIGLAVKCIR
jgi:hypothetical protein